MTSQPPDPYGPPPPPLSGLPSGPPSSPPNGPPPPGPDPRPAPATKHRRWPWVVGIVVALVAGVGIGASGQDAPPAEATTAGNDRQIATLQTSLEDTQEQLETVGDQRDAALEDLAAAEAARDSAQADLITAQDERDAAITRAEDAEDALAEAEETASADAAAEAAKAQFGDGTWVVGEDIEPGVYRNSGEGSWCYWERLSGLSGEFGDIIANDNPDGPSVVEIASSDAAFSSQGCGTWTRQ